MAKKNQSSKAASSSILFLDIDGVLNTNSFLKANWKGRDIPDYSVYIERSLVSELNRIFTAVPNLKFVIHSSWGKIMSEKKVISALKISGLKHMDRYLGLTPKKMSSYKCNEIVWWLDDAPEVDEYLVLDNDEIHFDHVERNQPRKRQTHFKTDENVGLTKEDADFIISWFLG